MRPLTPCLAALLALAGCDRPAVTVRETVQAPRVVVPEPTPPTPALAPTPEPKPPVRLARIIVPRYASEALAKDIRKTCDGVSLLIDRGQYWGAVDVALLGAKLVWMRLLQIRYHDAMVFPK